MDAYAPLLRVAAPCAEKLALTVLQPLAARPAKMLGISAERYLWRDGLYAEDDKQKLFPTPQAFHKAFRNVMSDWADLDIAATHYAYGNDVLCTEDKGSPKSDSIFGPKYIGDVGSTFAVRIMSLDAFARECWSRFGLPFVTWSN